MSTLIAIECLYFVQIKFIIEFWKEFNRLGTAKVNITEISIVIAGKIARNKIKLSKQLQQQQQQQIAFSFVKYATMTQNKLENSFFERLST